MKTQKGKTYSKEHLEAIHPFAIGQQKVYIEYMLEHDCSAAYTAKQLGKNSATVAHAVQAVERKAAKGNVGPDYMHLEQGGPLAPGQHLGKQTVHVKNGEIEQVWNRYEFDKDFDKLELLKEAISAMLAEYPAAACIDRVRHSYYDENVVPWYNIGDAHIGMLAHEMEVGENFDIKKATRELSVGLCSLIRNTEPAAKCVINDFGDATHYENMAGVTEASGHMLDCDGRFVKMIQAYVTVMIEAIDCALDVHDEVDVIINQGNHSRTNDLWMAQLLRMHYRDEPRVNVLDNTNVFTFYRMGKTQVLTHHSDKCKPDKLIDVLINDGRKDFGECEHHYIWVGHIHHRHTSNEFRGITIESFNTLANKDKYAHDGGWRSQQSITRVDLHKEYGEIGRATLNIRAVRAIIESQGGL